MPKQIIQILLWMDLLFPLADSFKSETWLKLQKQSVPQKKALLDLFL